MKTHALLLILGLLPCFLLCTRLTKRSLLSVFLGFVLAANLAHAEEAAELNPLASTATAGMADSQGSFTVKTGAKYLSPQSYKGGDVKYKDGVANPVLGLTDTAYSGGLLAPSLSFAVDRLVSVNCSGFERVRFVGELAYAGGSDQRATTQSPGGSNYLLALNIDPAWNWLGALDQGASANNNVSISAKNVDLNMALEGTRDGWILSNGIHLNPVWGAGFLASFQRYDVDTTLRQVASTNYSALSERIRTLDIGPQARVGVEAKMPGGGRMALKGSAALLLSRADLDANQNWQNTTSGFVSTGRPGGTSASASRDLHDTFVSGLFGLTFSTETAPVKNLKLGLEAVARYWTRRPTIENPSSITYTTVATTDHVNDGVRIGHDSAYELGVSLYLAYSF